MLNKWIYTLAMKRAQALVLPLLPWLKNNKGEILDLGCGLGHVGFLIAQLTKRKTRYLDIKKYPFAHPDINIILYDGVNIPFAKDSFATVIILYVLHHANNPLVLLEESKRVSKNEIIVCEDLILSEKEKRIMQIKDFLVNLGFSGWTLNYRLKYQWEDIFSKLELYIHDKIEFQSKNIFHFKHICWYLKKDFQ